MEKVILEPGEKKQISQLFLSEDKGKVFSV